MFTLRDQLIAVLAVGGISIGTLTVTEEQLLAISETQEAKINQVHELNCRSVLEAATISSGLDTPSVSELVQYDYLKPSFETDCLKYLQ